ncbi:hypothetical protein JCM8097_001706 [Rhodosporidiobolus ruineniae]
MAQAAVVSPLAHHLHDSSLSSALGTMRSSSGGSREPSPWSKFLSPSLFALDPAQRSSPLPAVAPTPSPLKQQHNHPSLFTHAKEINPFEQSFSSLSAGAAGPGGGAGGPDQLAVEGQADGVQRIKRKRALSSPAILTPGGTGANLADSTKEAFLHQSKRPSLRLAAQQGLPAHFVSTASFAPTESTFSSNGSFDETTVGSSLLRHRRGTSLGHTVSPDSSIAPSPHSDKLNSPFPPAAPFAHFQPAPVPFSIPLAPAGSAPYAAPSLFAASTLAPAILAAEAVAPLPLVSQAPIATFEPLGVPPHIAADSSFIYPNDPYAIPPFNPNNAAISVPLANPSGIVVGAPPVFPIDPSFAVIPPASLDPAPLPLAASVPIPVSSIPVVAPLAPAVPVAKKPAAPKPAAAKPPPPPAQYGPNGEPLAKPKPPGKKRGRKPKNWDPTLERAVELDPEEQERQRKLALERNRIAASKSRRRKKERVEMLETASTDLCNRNIALQAECRNLLAEVHSLRTFLTQAHPPGCSCVHVNGYLAREQDGGGIPAILYGAGATLERDFSQVPRWGTDEDCFAGTVEQAAMDALAAGGTLAHIPGLEDVKGPAPKGKKAKEAAAKAAQAVIAQVQAAELAALANGGGSVERIPLRSAPGQGMRATTEDPEDSEDDEDDHTESEEEAVELKSRRARAITAVRHKD